MNRLKNFSKVRVLIAGDVMLDKYLWGDVTRISPEAPVPVVNLKKTSFVVGGAANVAANVAGLGASALLLGVIGTDEEGEKFTETLEKTGVSAGHIVKLPARRTTVKTRILAHNQQIARLDQETRDELSESEEALILENFENIATNIDVIIVSDYAKGVLTEKFLARLIKHGRDAGKMVLVDPKGRDYSKYSNSTMITPNKFEIADACGCQTNKAEEIISAGEHLISSLNLDSVVVTRGEEGIILLEKNKDPFILNAVGRRVYDVTGAGDTFISTMAVASGAGETFREAARIANAAAGIIVERLGTSIIRQDDLKKVLEG